MSYDVFYRKYNNINPEIITLDELKVDMYDNIKPIGVPIVDLCMIKLIDNVINKMMIYSKWKIASNIVKDIVAFTFNNYPELPINEADIFDKVEELKTRNKEPILIQFEVTKLIKNNIDNKFIINVDTTENEQNTKDIIKKYDILIGNLYNYYFKYSSELENTVLLKYKLEWNEIDNQYTELIDSILKLYDSSIKDNNFIDTIILITDISNQSKNKIDKLIKKYITDFNNDNCNLIAEKSNNKYLFENLKLLTIQSDKLKDLFTVFNPEMDKIYETIIKSKNFEKNINDMLLEHYNQEKEIYRLNLKIEFLNNLKIYLN
jgi:hypothetical protein